MEAGPRYSMPESIPVNCILLTQCCASSESMLTSANYWSLLPRKGVFSHSGTNSLGECLYYLQKGIFPLLLTCDDSNNVFFKETLPNVHRLLCLYMTVPKHLQPLKGLFLPCDVFWFMLIKWHKWHWLFRSSFNCKGISDLEWWKEKIILEFFISMVYFKGLY